MAASSSPASLGVPLAYVNISNPQIFGYLSKGLNKQHTIVEQFL